jgi:drug/metabolite transporter (DMT)-like permease
MWRRAAGDPAPNLSNWKSTAIVGTALLLGGNGFVAWAEQTVPSGIAALMITTSPFWLVLFEALRAGGTKPTWQAILGLILGFVGVFILVGPAEITGVEGGFDTFGIILLLLAPLFWSMGSIYARGADMPKSTLLSTGMQMLTGALALFLVSLVKGELNGFSLGIVSTRSWLALAYLITFGSLIGFVSYGWLLHNAPVSLLSTYAYVNPVVAVLLGNWLADEPLNGRILVAAAIIIGSVVLINSARPATAPIKTPELQAVPDGDD